MVLMSETRDFLKSRRALLERRLARLMAELEEVRLAEEALEGRKERTSERQLSLVSHFATGLASPDFNLTIKDKIVRVMFRAQRPLSSRAILKLIHEQYGEELPRTSFSPQISRLVQEERVILNRETRRYELSEKEAETLARDLK